MKRLPRSLKSILFISLILMTSMTFFSCSTPKEKFTGLQLWSVREDMMKDPAATIAQVGTMGYKFVEAAGYSDGKFYKMEPEAFKKLVADNGMEFLSSHCGHNLPDSASWDEAMAWWDQCIAAHKAAGVKYIIQASMGPDAYRSLDTLKMYCDYFNKVGEKCNAAGIRFGYHNHSGEFKTVFDGQPVYDHMLQNTAPDNVFFETDLYWMHDGGGDFASYVEKYPGRFMMYHVKDYAELGSGSMDFKTPFELAGKAGMKYYVVEVENYNFTPIESVQKSIEFLNSQEYVK